MQRRSVLSVHGHSSTGVTLQLTTGVEFRKKSIRVRSMSPDQILIADRLIFA